MTSKRVESADLLAPAQAAERLGVREVLHFTTDRGVMGALRKGCLLSRSRVVDDPELAFISLSVWPNRDREPHWADYVSLSIHSINLDLWERAERNLPERWWAIMAFDPAVLDLDGTWFATTNNIYPACRRGQGTDGLMALYDDQVLGRYSDRHDRRGLAPAQPTDRAAEVLCPESVDLEHLLRIYVRTAEDRRTVRAWCTALDLPFPTVAVSPETFG